MNDEEKTFSNKSNLQKLKPEMETLSERCEYFDNLTREEWNSLKGSRNYFEEKRQRRGVSQNG